MAAPLIVVAALILLAVAAELWGFELRPGFDGRTDRRERWFIHIRNE